MPTQAEKEALFGGAGTSWSDILFGQRSRDVQAPGGIEAGMETRRRLGQQLEAQALGQQPSEAERAIGLEAAIQAELLARRQQSMAAGARGFGAIGAQQQAAANVAQAQQGLAGSVAAATGRQRASDIASGQAGLAALLSDEERAAYMLDEYRRANAAPGLLPAITTGIGAAAGGYLGGAEGARAGGTLGGAVAQPFMRR